MVPSRPKVVGIASTKTRYAPMREVSYKFRLYPTPAQSLLLNKHLELCRWVYNTTIACRKTLWTQERISLSRFGTHNLLPDWKKYKPELNEVYSQVLQEAQKRVDVAYREFFRRIAAGEHPGYPRFRGFGRYNSITYPQYGHCGSVLLRDNGLRLSKIGLVKINIHREIPDSATIKTVTIKKEADRWYATFSTERSSDTKKHKCGKGIVGIDLGCKTFLVLSDKKKVGNPKFISKALKRIAKANRKLSRQPRGTPERAKARKVLSKIYQKINNRRNDFLHKESRKLVGKYETLVFEDLHIKDMVREKPWHNLNRTILDSSWGQFVRFCSYKAEYAGGKVIKVNPKNTSKMCSKCGTIVDKDLSCRIHSCPHCGLTIDRDLNAALNILRLGQQSLAKA